MNFAVVEIAGKQFLIRKNDVIETPKIPGSAEKKATFPSVLLYWNGKKVAVGRPYLEGFSVEGKILESGRSPKVVVYKFKRRKDSHRKIGHRQDFTRILRERFKIPDENTEGFFNEARDMNFYDEQTMTARELFEKYFPGRDDVVRMLMEPITYANGSTLDDPAISYGIVFSNFMSKGVYTVQGGTDKFDNHHTS